MLGKKVKKKQIDLQKRRSRYFMSAKAGAK
jgi:hypothetical protein